MVTHVGRYDRHNDLDRDTAMRIAFKSTADGVTARAAEHKVSRQTVRRAISTGAYSLMLAQQKELLDHETEILLIMEKGGRLERATDMLRWDETQQALCFQSELLEGER